MRRIPLPQRALDRSLSASNPLPNLSPFSQCRRATSPHPLLRTTYASFSTTPKLEFLLGKQDPKKHQQLVRRWQKRLLGDSEPIGAHVDPFDPTSPVRIAPEDQGDELEVLAEGEASRDMNAIYEEESKGERLRRVGGDKWVEQLEEGKIAREYEKLTLRTYTPLTHKMADQIEDLTGTMYTLRDNNLMMAQKFHDFSNKPYTEWSFGRATPIRDLPTIRRKFHQAVIEIYAIRQGRPAVDVTSLPNRGVYDVPKWIDEVQLLYKGDGKYRIVCPTPYTREDPVKAMEQVPEWSNGEEWSSEQQLLEDIESAVEEEAPVVEDPAPQMDPNTPAFKRAAVVKQDDSQKPFDFMSNRPVPRSTPQDPAPNTASTTEEQIIVEEVISSETALPTNADAVIVAEQETATTKKDTPVKAPKLSSKETRWRDVPLTAIDMKFALSKRMAQLTGLHVSDPALTHTTSLGDLYEHFCAASKPKATKLFSYLHAQGQHQAEVAKKAAAQDASLTPRPVKSNLSTLLKLKNVELLRKRPNAKELRTKKGLNKVIAQELRRGGIGAGPARPGYRASRREKSYVKLETRPIEGTGAAPDFGVAVSPTAAEILKKRTQRRKQEWFDTQDKSWKQVDMLIRERKFAPTESKSQL